MQGYVISDNPSWASSVADVVPANLFISLRVTDIVLWEQFPITFIAVRNDLNLSQWSLILGLFCIYNGNQTPIGKKGGNGIPSL